ncbi:hypothetical protein [Deinococcus sp. QL22]|uniref:hypothetical protein n=1 Tax=Deinococcus sp. QL22 TaxID=2939437 RepID=UPI00201806FE|nr:hypothetical protein [Deinococcus sp. QL22]UQN05400.1 hypothetical protein M1R55_10985 [Deinococcus sp. QL22]
MDEDLTRFASNEIINYVNAHPDSADTVNGIHQWWIQWPDAAGSLQVTVTALEQLQWDGLMEMVPIGDGGRILWRRRRE